jgi:hypothetical protein
MTQCNSWKKLPEIDPSFGQNASMNGLFSVQKGEYVKENTIAQITDHVLHHCCVRKKQRILQKQ